MSNVKYLENVVHEQFNIKALDVNFREFQNEDSSICLKHNEFERY